MKENPGGTNQENTSVSNLHSLKKRLGTMSPSQILDELKMMTDQARAANGDLDPNIVLAYYEVLDEVDPIKVPKDACAKSLELFARNHPEFLQPQPVNVSSTINQQRISSLFVRHRAVVAVAILAIFGLGSVAVAYEVPQRLISWGIETFQLGPPCGDMRLSQPTEDGYYTLEDALDAYDVDTASPTWMPGRSFLDDVSVIPNEMWNTYLAVYMLQDKMTNLGVIKVTEYFDPQNIPMWRFEDEGEEARETQYVGEIEVSITRNKEDTRISWKSGNCIGSVYGQFTESEITQIVKSIKMREA